MEKDMCLCSGFRIHVFYVQGLGIICLCLKSRINMIKLRVQDCVCFKGLWLVLFSRFKNDVFVLKVWDQYVCVQGSILIFLCTGFRIKVFIFKVQEWCVLCTGFRINVFMFKVQEWCVLCTGFRINVFVFMVQKCCVCFQDLCICV